MDTLQGLAKGSFGEHLKGKKDTMKNKLLVYKRCKHLRVNLKSCMSRELFNHKISVIMFVFLSKHVAYCEREKIQVTSC